MLLTGIRFHVEQLPLRIAGQPYGFPLPFADRLVVLASGGDVEAAYCEALVDMPRGPSQARFSQQRSGWGAPVIWPFR